MSTAFSTKRLFRVALVAITLASTTAFAPPTIPSSHVVQPQLSHGLLTPSSKRTSSVSLFAKSKKDFFLPSPSANNRSLTLALPTGAGTTVLLGTPAAALVWETLTALPTPNPFVVGEILTDLSHVFLDLITLWGPNAVVVRLFAVIGRVFCVLADFVPDHAMNPEEVVFQGFMLAVACTGLFQVMLPQIWSRFLAPKPTLRDGKAYAAWGKPAGMSWDQYKVLTVSALEWKELAPGETLDTAIDRDKNRTTLYWLYKGEARVERGSSGKGKSQVIRRTTGRLRQVDGAQKVDLASFQTSSPDTEKPATITAGPQGATLLMCHADRLKALMRHDTSMKDVWKVILWQGLQDQLADAYQYESG
eukprot:scaffold46144_cov199-Amphora_coffeaeformis.AAC.1